MTCLYFIFSNNKVAYNKVDWEKASNIYAFLCQEFFIALRLVACAQNGLEVSLSSLNLAVPPPRFVRNDFIYKIYQLKDQG